MSKRAFKRIENYRKGDRAEKFGVFLLQSLCAVAEVPRQEDFGLMDAVATLLRRDGKFLIAEDSFLVQVKSRTEKVIEYFGERFTALLSQDLPVVIAQVNLTTKSIELHTLGVALAHTNINDAKGLVWHLSPPKEPCPFGLVGGVLHVPLSKPILQWSVAETESREFKDNAYEVLKAWFNLERWNRRFRSAGMSRSFAWETNKIPTVQWERISFNPARQSETLGEILPICQLLAAYSMFHSELRAPALAIIEWLRKKGVDADPQGLHTTSILQSVYNDQIKKILHSNPEADIAIAIRVMEARQDYLSFWLHTYGRTGGSGRRFSGSLSNIRDECPQVTVEVAPENPAIKFGLSNDWLTQRHLTPLPDPIIEKSDQWLEGPVFLLRKISELDPGTKP